MSIRDTDDEERAERFAAFMLEQWAKETGIPAATLAGLRERKLVAVPRHLRERKLVAVPRHLRERKLVAVPRHLRERKLVAVPREEIQAAADLCDDNGLYRMADRLYGVLEDAKDRTP